MGAPYTTTYKMPKLNCSRLLGELHAMGFLSSEDLELTDEGLIVHTLKKQPKHFAPPLIFYECRPDDTARKVEIMWIKQNIPAAELIEQVIYKHGGTFESGLKVSP